MQQLFLRSFIEYYKRMARLSKATGSRNATHTANLQRSMGHTWTINDTRYTVNAYYTQMDFLTRSKLWIRTVICLLVEYIAVTRYQGMLHDGIGRQRWQQRLLVELDRTTGERRYTYGARMPLPRPLKPNPVGRLDMVHMLRRKHRLPATVNAQFNGNGQEMFRRLPDRQSGLFTQGGGEISSVKGWMMGVYAQDQIRIKPNLTVTVAFVGSNTLPRHRRTRLPVASGVQSTMFPNAPWNDLPEMRT